MLLKRLREQTDQEVALVDCADKQSRRAGSCWPFLSRARCVAKQDRDKSAAVLLCTSHRCGTENEHEVSVK
jgi:hypothetical protein